MVVPSLFRLGSGLTVMKTNRSPGGPPRRPLLPSSRTRSRLSVSTPAGTRRLMRLVLRTRPSPPQVPQGVVRSPVPWHSPQSCTCWNTPSGVRTAVATCPAPPQALQVEGLVPALAPLPSHVPHSVILSTSMSTEQPKTASLKLMERSCRLSSPACARLRCLPPPPKPPPPKPPPPPPPPKNCSKMSKGLLKSLAPPMPMPCFRPASPYLS
mmetsp:Transcript_9983/g.29946  ORF Transcript_9983/g.29946 Transcript_9983/m.29946 type:complete len:211 (+) Transcript_9983:3590-4222(+)